MKTILRWLAILLGGLVVLSVALSVIVMLLVDPNEYKDEIATAVTEQTGRSFTIEGDLSLQTFPCCGIKLGPMALGNPPGFPAEDFARVEGAAVSIRLWPLLTRQELLVGDVEIQGFDVRLISKANGETNWEFAATETATAPAATGPEAESSVDLAALDIAGVAVSNGRIVYLDESTGDELEISDINLATGPISFGKPFDLSSSLRAAGFAPDTQAALELDARVNLDTETQLLDLENVQGKVQLEGADLPGGSVSIELGLAAARDLGAARSALEGLVSTLRAANVEVEITGDGALVDNNPELAGSIKVAEFNPRELLAALGEPPMVTNDPQVLTRYAMRGDWSLAGDQAAIENIATTLDDTQVSGWFRVKSLEKQALAFELALDSIDVDRYMAPAAEESTDAEAGPAATGDESLDLPVDDLRALDLQGRIGIGQMKFSDARLNDVNINVRAKDGLIRLNPLTAVLYDGSYSGDVRLDVRGAKPKLSVNENLSGVQLGTLLADMRDQQNLSGTGNVRFNAAATGNSINELLGNLSGDAALDLREGIYQGTDIWYEIRKTRAQIRGKEMPLAPENPRTEISQFSGTAKFADGIVRNDRFNAEIPFIRLGGKGDINLLQSTMDYRLEARVVKTPRFDDGEQLDDLNGLVLPIELTGDMDAPKVTVDLTSIAVSIGQNKLRDRLRKKLGIEESSDEPATQGAEGDGQQKEQPPKDPEDQLKETLFDMFTK